MDLYSGKIQAFGSNTLTMWSPSAELATVQESCVLGEHAARGSLHLSDYSKSPAQKASSCELLKMQTCIPSTQACVRLQLALHLPLLRTLRLCRLSPPPVRSVPAPVGQRLQCTAVLFKVLYYKIKHALFLCVLLKSYLCEKYYTPISVLYYRADCQLGSSAHFVGLRNKLGLQMCSQNRTHSYVEDLLYSLNGRRVSGQGSTPLSFSALRLRVTTSPLVPTFLLCTVRECISGLMRLDEGGITYYVSSVWNTAGHSQFTQTVVLFLPLSTASVCPAQTPDSAAPGWKSCPWFPPLSPWHLLPQLTSSSKKEQKAPILYCTQALIFYTRNVKSHSISEMQCDHIYKVLKTFRMGDPGILLL